MNALPATAAHTALLDQRRRFAATLCQGRRVGSFPGNLGDDSVEILLSLESLARDDILRELPAWLGHLSPGGIMVIAEAVMDLPDVTPLRTILRRQFQMVSTFQQHPLTGSVIAGERQTASRILPLAEPVQAQPSCLLHIASDTKLPELSSVFLELGGIAAGQQISHPLLVSPPAPRPLAPEQQVLRQRAVALVERCSELNASLFDQHAQNLRLQDELQRAPSVPSSVFDIPRARHGWPLADDRSAVLDVYGHRVDDAVLLEADAGTRFLDRYALLGPSPNYTDAIAALNAAPKPLLGQDPDVTIVIPVYGQLGYTLNCLDSLFKLVGSTRAEVIVVDDASPDQTADRLVDVAGIHLVRQPVNGGFIASCNAGAARAKAGFVVFLNNDTRVVDRWLDTLVAGFTQFPKAGLVGSKMLYPDGTLQEAGGIIWRDGSCWNDGRNDDPNRPLYAYARQVDYISGCSIMLRLDLFRSLGGFDAHFAPAYCEDADLALRVRKEGLEVWYQPQSRVVHYEGRTSGTDLDRGVKSYQRINSRKLFLRWRAALASHGINGDAPLLRRERQVTRRALVIDATAPTPSEDAGSVTTCLTLQLFQTLGYKVHFVPQDNFLFQDRYCTDLMAKGVDVAYAPYEVGIDSYLRRHGWSFDVVFVFRVTVLETILQTIRTLVPQAPLLFHTMDLHFLRMERQAELDDEPAARAAAAAMKQRELSLIGTVDCTITHSTFEKGLLSTAAPKAPTIVWPFMFECHGTEVDCASRRDICFLGGYRHAPNVDAVTFFAHDVLPLILQQEPNIRFIIAGANPTPEVLALAGPHIIVTGQIADLRDLFDATRVFACSLRIGAGTKGKVSTAMAYGVPVVSTHCGAEGMELQDGDNVLLADTAEDFAQACLRLYRDSTLWQRLSDQGQALVRCNHSLDMGRDRLEAAIETAWKHKLELEQDPR